MTTRFGAGSPGVGYGPQMQGMGPTPNCPTCGLQMGFPTMGMPQYMGGMMPPMGMPQYTGGMMPPMGMPQYMGGMTPPMGMPQYMGGMMPPTGFPGYGTWPSYGQGWWPTYQGVTVPDDESIREMIFDSIDADPLVPYDSDINVEVTGGLVVLTGTVPNKRVKHSVGDDAWWIPGVFDVNNQLQITGRPRRERTTETPPTTGRRRATATTPTRPTGRTEPRRPAGTT